MTRVPVLICRGAGVRKAKTEPVTGFDPLVGLVGGQIQLAVRVVAPCDQRAVGGERKGVVVADRLHNLKSKVVGITLAMSEKMVAVIMR